MVENIENEVKKTTKRLLLLSDLILKEFEVLSDLSRLNGEDSPQFHDHLEDVNAYLDEETRILDSLDLVKAELIFKEIGKCGYEDEAANRSYDIFEDLIDKLGARENAYRSEDFEESEDSYEEEESYDELDNMETPDYFAPVAFELDEGDEEVHFNHLVSKIAVRALKIMLNRINAETTDNKDQDQYKKKMLKSLRVYKYTVFGLTRELEIIGAKNGFDISKIKEPDDIDADLSTLCYNQCVRILQKLYDVNNSERDFDKVDEALFDMICFEEYLKEVQSEILLERLLNLCKGLRDRAKSNQTFGEFGYYTLVKKKN